MALVRSDRHATLAWPPDFVSRLFDQDWNRSAWLRIEEFRDGDQWVLRAEIPDINPEKDIELSVSDDSLRIHAERRQSAESTDKAGYSSEFRYGSFDREFDLPAGAKADDIKATYDKGILEVRIPMPAAKKSSVKSIPVTVGS